MKTGRSELDVDDGFMIEISERLQRAVAEIPEIKQPTIAELEARIQAKDDARLINRLKASLVSAGGAALEACGFGHSFGDHGVNKAFGNLGQVSYGADGKEYSTTDRMAKKVATCGAFALAAYLARNGAPSIF